MRLGRILEGEFVPDDRSDSATFPEPEDVLGGAGDERRIAADEPPEVEAVDADVAADEPGGVELLPHAARVADGNGRAHRLQESERLLEDTAADEVEDDVDLVELCDALVGHGLDGAQRARELELLLAADRSHRGSVQCRDD